MDFQLNPSSAATEVVFPVSAVLLTWPTLRRSSEPNRSSALMFGGGIEPD